MNNLKINDMFKLVRALALSLLAVSILSGCNSQKTPDESWSLTPFTKIDEVNPVLHPNPNSTFLCPVRMDSVHWEEKDVFNPAAVVKNGKVYLLYRAEDTVGKYAGTSRIGMAISDDGLHFKTQPTPVFYPDNDAFSEYEWEGGCEDPRIVEDENGTYYMTYTAYNGDKARLFVATSNNLINWTKHGSVFNKAADGKYVKIWSKSGSIVTKRVGEKLVATKINGKYWMYFGESNIYVATSENLIDWEPVEETDESKKQYDEMRQHEAFKIIFAPRKGKFDSELVEPGPPAILTEKGIVFIYNSKNHKDYGDANLAAGTYSAGQVLLDSNDPTQVIARTESNFFKPEKPYEITGQVNSVSFLEGLVYFKDKWLLYYGTADSKIAVAESTTVLE
jgi:predicted GH43/DUF377 family glycosyl hydrolase